MVVRDGAAADLAQVLEGDIRPGLQLSGELTRERSISIADGQDDLKDALISAFTSEKEGLNKFNAWISTTLTKLVQTAEAEDESGGFTQPEGWCVLSACFRSPADSRMLCSFQVTIIQRLLELGLLQRSDASAILPGMTIPAIGNGESLTVSGPSGLQSISKDSDSFAGPHRFRPKVAFEGIVAHRGVCTRSCCVIGQRGPRGECDRSIAYLS